MTANKRLGARLAAVAVAALLTAQSEFISAQTEDAKSVAEAARQFEKLRREQPREFEQVQSLYLLETRRLLGNLGYEVGPSLPVMDKTTESSLRLYQADRKLPVTGSLSFQTIRQVNADRKLLDTHYVNLPMKQIFLDMWKDGYVSASGTWTITGEKSGSPEQTTKFVCNRQQQTCVESTAIINRGFGLSVSMLLETYEIERWDEHEIVTRP